MTSKFCSKCQLTKPTYKFNHDSYATDGFQHKCKACNVENIRQWVNNIRNYVNEKKRIDYATNPQRRISECIHKRLMNTLRKGIYTRRTAEIIDLSEVQWLDWLVYNFEGDMWFQNYGTLWQFDLVTPASAHNLTTEEGLLAAFNWKNIRPCLKSDNAAKYNFIMPFAQANQSIPVLAFIRKMRLTRLEAFLDKFE